MILLKRILLVEDRDFEAKRVLALKDKYDIIHRHRGDLALNYLNRNPVDLVLLDLNLLDMHGYEILKKIREDARMARLPVIILTGNDKPADEVEGLRKGANDFVRKPFSEAILRLRVQKELDMQDYIQQINMLQYVDGLTGSFNRKYFDMKIKEIFEWHKEKKQSFVYFFTDIDKFKDFNTDYGHHGGDECLRQYVQTISTYLRRKADTLYRYGGEEFVVTIVDSTKENASDYIIGLHKTIRETPITLPDGQVVNITCSMGAVECLPDESTVLDEVLKKANAAMNTSKNEGRDRITWSS